MLMKTDILVDTNILIYAYDGQSAFNKTAINILNDPSYSLFVSTKNLSEFFAVLSKQNQPFLKVYQFYEAILENTSVLFPNKDSLLLFEELMKKYQPKGNRVYDLEIISIALAFGVQTLCTINAKDFAGISEIILLTP